MRFPLRARLFTSQRARGTTPQDHSFEMLSVELYFGSPPYPGCTVALNAPPAAAVAVFLLNAFQRSRVTLITAPHRGTEVEVHTTPSCRAICFLHRPVLQRLHSAIRAILLPLHF